MLKGRLYIKEQEESGTYQFTGIPTYMTCGFQSIFENEAQEIISTALMQILEKYPGNADYLQVFTYHREEGEVIKFWCINDVDHITFLLPEEY